MYDILAILANDILERHAGFESLEVHESSFSALYQTFHYSRVFVLRKTRCEAPRRALLGPPLHMHIIIPVLFDAAGTTPSGLHRITKHTCHKRLFCTFRLTVLRLVISRHARATRLVYLKVFHYNLGRHRM